MITYENKEDMYDNNELDRKYKCVADDLNEIKQEHNNLETMTLLTGEMKIYAGATAPNGWLICDGSAISRTTYSNLFAVIGTKFGIGDGSTTFNIPDMRGKVAVGVDSTDTYLNDLGKEYGEKTHTLTVDEIPAHNHRTGRLTGNLSGNTYSLMSDQTNDGHRYTDNTGGGQAHNNMQPSVAINYIIKT